MPRPLPVPSVYERKQSTPASELRRPCTLVISCIVSRLPQGAADSRGAAAGDIGEHPQGGLRAGRDVLRRPWQAFQATRFHAACEALGIRLVHSAPYQSECRGIIERLNRAVKEQFETEVRGREEPPPLDELNALERHLKAAGARKNPFEAEATTALFHHSRGIPRLVQNIALAAMLAALEGGKKTIDAAAVQQAVVDLETV